MDWEIATDVSEEHTAFIFSVKLCNILVPLDPEYEGTTVLRNVGRHSTSNTASHSRRNASSATPL
jgi:hypothetical protein